MAKITDDAGSPSFSPAKATSTVPADNKALGRGRDPSPASSM